MQDIKKFPWVCTLDYNFYESSHDSPWNSTTVITLVSIKLILFYSHYSIKVPQVHLLPIESRKVLPNWNPNEGKASRFGMVDAPFVYQTTCQVDPMLNFSRHVHIFRLDILKILSFVVNWQVFRFLFSLNFILKTWLGMGDVQSLSK